MRRLLTTLALIFLLSVQHALGERLTKEEIEELKKRLATVRTETVREARALAEIRRREAIPLGPEFAECVNEATKDLENGVVQELESRIGVLEQELAGDKPLEREDLKRKVETATVGAGVAVEKRTTAFVMKVFSCTRKALNSGSVDEEASVRKNT